MTLHRLPRLILAALAIALFGSVAAVAAPDDGCGTPAAPQRCAFWSTTYDGAGGADRYNNTVLTSDGSLLLATGQTGGSDGTFKFVTAAYDAASGTERWTAQYDGAGSGNDFARDVAVSPEGATVFVVGDSSESGGDSDLTTIAYDTFTGEQRWIAHVDGPAGLGDTAVAVAASPDGQRVYVTGYVALPGIQGPLGAATIAYDAWTGEQIWEHLHRGPAAFWDIPRAITVAPKGGADRVLVTTRSNVQGTGNNQVDAGVIAYDGETGSVDWVSYYDYYGDGSSREEPFSIAATKDGARAYIVVEGPFGYNIVAWDLADGSEIWHRVHNGSARPLGIAVSPDGSKIAATGWAMHEQGGNAYRAVDTVAYSSTGDQLWFNRMFPTGGGTGYRIAFDQQGRRVYVAGLLVGQAVGAGVGTDVGGTGVGTSYSGLLTLAYDVADGAIAWQASAQESGGANGLAVHPNGARVYVGGGNTDAIAAAYDTGFEPPVVTDPVIEVYPAFINAANQHAVTIGGRVTPNNGWLAVVADTQESRGCGSWSVDGTFSCTTDASGLPDGPLEARARAYDGVGGYSELVRIPIVKDTVVTPPAIDAGSVINGQTQTAATLAGSAEDGASVAVSLSDGTTTVSGSGVATGGRFSVPLDASALADGSLTATATQTDPAGNASAAATRVRTKDTAGPAAPTVTEPVAGGMTGSPVHFAGTTEPGAQVLVYEGATVRAYASASTSGAWSTNATIGAGARTATVRARDAAGNLGAPTTVSFQVSPPGAPVITAPVQDATTTGTITIAGTATPRLRVRVSDGTTTLGTVSVGTDGTWKMVKTLPDGPHELSAVMLDASGTAGPASAPVAFTVDARAPSVAFTTDDLSLHTETILTGSAEDDRILQQVELTVRDAAGAVVLTTQATCAACGTGGASDWEATLDLLPGVYEVRAVSRDAAGNPSTVKEITIVTL